jgi:hypothetical protein
VAAEFREARSQREPRGAPRSIAHRGPRAMGEPRPIDVALPLAITLAATTWAAR